MSVADPARYGQIARLLHWLAALLLIITFVLGAGMDYVGHSPLHDRMFNWHRAFGVLVLGVIVVRLLWRLTHPAPPLPASISGLQAFAAHATHWLLYLLLIVQPMLGWLGESAFGSGVPVFRLFELPPIIGKDEALAKVLMGIHGWVGWAILWVVVVHVAAALYHTVRGDGVLKRMWW